MKTHEESWASDLSVQSYAMGCTFFLTTNSVACPMGGIFIGASENVVRGERQVDVICCAAIQLRRRLIVSDDQRESMERTLGKFEELTAEAQAARLLQRRELGFSVRHFAAEMGLPVERAGILMCRGLSTLLARGYPAEDLCETYRVTPEQLSRVATVPAFSSMFEPLAASR